MKVLKKNGAKLDNNLNNQIDKSMSNKKNIYKSNDQHMDQISVESSNSSNSSCSLISYEGTDGYISDGEDPFIQPIELSSQDDQQFFQEPSEAHDSFEQQEAPRMKTQEEYAEQRKKRQKREQCNNIEIQINRSLTNSNLEGIPLFFQILTHELVLKPKQKIHEEKMKQSQTSSKMSSLDSESRQKWLAQRRLAAMAFVELGYGITKMRKFIEQNQINMQIDIVTYQDIIVKLLKDAYKRLQRFLRKKCHKKVIKLTTPTQEKYLLQVLKDCRHKLDKFEIHNLFKLIKPTYIKNEQFKISKRIASRLYHSCKEYISRKKIKVGLINIDNPDCEIFNNDRAKWTQEMIQTAVALYIKEGSLSRVREIMSKTCDVQQYLVDNRNIKYHIANKVKQALDFVMKLIEQSKKAFGSFKLRDLVKLDSQRVSEIVNHVQATNVRIILLQINTEQSPSMIHLNQAILAVNQFILKRDNQKMREEIRRTDRQYDLRENQFQRRRRSRKR